MTIKNSLIITPGYNLFSTRMMYSWNDLFTNLIYFVEIYESEDK